MEGQSPRRGPDRWLLIALGAVVAILAFDAAGMAANALLSNRYGPERAVTDYFAAQSRADVSAMLANATFQPGSDAVFFSRSAISAMMELPQNKDVHNVRIISAQSVDPSSAIVNVSMTWAGNAHRQAYRVREDSSRLHEMLYHSWRVVIPFVTVRLVLPNQSGPISIDGINPASPDTTVIEVVEGYHQVTMASNRLYDSTTRLVDGVDDAGVVGFPFAVGFAAYRLAARAVIVAFETCDPAKRPDCLNHTYSASAGYEFIWGDLPGYGRVTGATYRITLADDPTTYMNVAVPADPGMLDASGECTVTMTVDGTTNYRFDGGWSAMLTTSNPGFTANLTYENCFFEGGPAGVST